VTVEASGYGTDVATVTLWQKPSGCWEPAAGPWSGFIGYDGFAAPGQKREGDGKTPSGVYGFGPVVYGNAANPGVHETYQPIDCGDWWDEDSSSPTYNTFQDLSCSDTNPPFNNGSSEKLWEEANAYPSFAVIDYNTGPITKGAGSAIFLHASLGHGTAGCVSVPLADLDWFLRWMEPSQDPLVVMGTAAQITRF
jgi:L,D-peptidoglycan transpeptidase YkuD (ErfK/YbiS/YcfS/YnhG family)